MNGPGEYLTDALRDRDRLWCAALLDEDVAVMNRILIRFNASRPDKPFMTADLRIPGDYRTVPGTLRSTGPSCGIGEFAK